MADLPPIGHSDLHLPVSGARTSIAAITFVGYAASSTPHQQAGVVHGSSRRLQGRFGIQEITSTKCGFVGSRQVAFQTPPRFVGSHDHEAEKTRKTFCLPPNGTRERRWAVTIVNDAYLVGRFDDKTVTPGIPALPGDGGASFYATQTFGGIPAQGGRRF